MRALVFGLLMAAGQAVAQNALWLDLRGDWRVFTGDRPEFAATDFDDRAWQTLSLPSEDTWPSARGRAWLRCRVELPQNTDVSDLALTLGAIQDVYQVYVNGTKIGQSGDFNSFSETEIPRPRTFLIPAGLIAPKGPVQIAIRARRTLFMSAKWRLGAEGPWLLSGRLQAPADAGRQAIRDRWVRHSPGLLFGTIFVFIAFLSFLAWQAEREHRELLWFALVSLVHGCSLLYELMQLSPANHPFNSRGFSATIVVSGLALPLLGEFVMVALKRRNGWLRVTLWLGWSVVPWTVFSGGDYRMTWFGNSWAACFAVVVIARDWWPQRGRRLSFEDHVLRLLLLLPSLAWGEPYIRRLFGSTSSERPGTISLGAWFVQREDVSWLVLSVGILALLLKRLAADRRERQRLTGELQAARAVQQLLFASSPASEGESPIEAVYEPAQEVGGDFYHILPLGDGSHLVAVGDVSGKGLKAAMTVSLLTGALRNRKASEPGALLSELNQAVTGGLDGAFVTAAAARCYPDGRVTIASAGHPAPYLAGEEVTLQPALPLGMDGDAEYPESELMLSSGQQLTFVSDGVIEAANTKRELFGFDRTRQISGQSASAIAGAAKAWGQDDDITVVTIRRLA